jgi:hypothetical protein
MSRETFGSGRGIPPVSAPFSSLIVLDILFPAILFTLLWPSAKNLALGAEIIEHKRSEGNIHGEDNHVLCYRRIDPHDSVSKGG